MNDTKNKVLSGIIWKFAERISAQIVTFIVSIVLARVLSPSHYGAIAIVNIFIALANVFVVNGFGNSLIQKKNADDTDFSSVFYFNLLFSFLKHSFQQLMRNLQVNLNILRLFLLMMALKIRLLK